MDSSDQQKWRLTNRYGYLEEENKQKTSTLIETLYNNQNLPWVCCGDFNLMLWFTEKQGGGDFKFEEAAILCSAFDFYKLEDMGFIRHPFTWKNNQGAENNIQERLDRYVTNTEWRELFAGSFVSHLEKRKSDRLPLVLCVKARINAPITKKKKEDVPVRRDVGEG